MIDTFHWAKWLMVGDRCLATIRHPTDGSKNLHKLPVVVIDNQEKKRTVSVAHQDTVYKDVPYNELTPIRDSS